MSNRAAVLDVIPENHRAKGMEMLNMEFDYVQVERVYGVEWSIKSDTFKFRVQIKERPLTRRGMLSTIASIYDPLGMLSPVILTSKRIMRDLCRSEIGWDDHVPDSIAKQWLKLIQQLPLLDRFEVDHCLKPPHFGLSVQQSCTICAMQVKMDMEQSLTWYQKI